MTSSAYTAEPVTENGDLTDLRIHIGSKVWHLWGRKGAERETTMAEEVPQGTLPILIGSGLGHCLKKLLANGFPIIVIDREAPLLDLTGNKEVSDTPNILWIDNADPVKAFEQITQWQQQHGNRLLTPVITPLYLRLDRDYYGALAETMKAANKANFWSQARYPKFRSASPKVLFFDSNYFLCNEILSALDTLGVESRSVLLDNRETGSQDFIEAILKAVVDFRPDFVLTVNHFGLDREGKLAGLLNDLKLPLASWFVDNPHLILFDYAHPGADNTIIFTFDAGNLDQMKAKGFPHVHYLPLATDPKRFRPAAPQADNPTWTADVSFVGNSMTTPTAKSLRDACLPDTLQREYESVARGFGQSGETQVDRFLRKHQPRWFEALKKLPTRENRLALESLLTWEATRQYRLACIKQTLRFNPLIVGDNGWHPMLSESTGWRHLPPLDYYDDLPRFYPLSTVNFNCTSRQMVGAVNQRVFDVPACGGFLITDHREQMEDLFDLDTEAVVYREIGEIPQLIEHFLKDPKKRLSTIQNCRTRILAHHTYAKRLSSLLETMRTTFQ